MPKLNTTYYRKLTGPKMREPYARTLGSGYRLWNPDRTFRNSKWSFPFEVMAGPHAAVLCRIEAGTVDRSNRMLGQRFHYLISLWLIDRATLVNSAVIYSVYSNRAEADRRVMLRRGCAAASILHQQLTRSGFTRPYINSALYRWLNQETTHEGERSEEVAGDTDHDQGTATGTDSVSDHVGGERRPMGHAHQDEEKQVGNPARTRGRRIEEGRLPRL
jgi:hypothetical protein